MLYLLQLKLLECLPWFSDLLTQIDWLQKWPILQYRFAVKLSNNDKKEYGDTQIWPNIAECRHVLTEKVQWMQTIRSLQLSYMTIYTIWAFAQRQLLLHYFLLILPQTEKGFQKNNPVSIILALWIRKSVKLHSPPGTDSKISLALNLCFTLNSPILSSGDLSVSFTCDVVTATWRLSTREENVQNYTGPLNSSFMHKSMT